MKIRLLILLILSHFLSVFSTYGEESHLGGVAEIRLMVSSITQREQGVVSNVGNFSFPAFAATWDGVFTEGSDSVLDNDKVTTCINTALSVAQSSNCQADCQYDYEYQVVIGYDQFGFAIYDWRWRTALDADCYYACVNRTEAEFLAAQQACINDSSNQMTVDYGSVQKLFSVKLGKVYEIDVSNAGGVFSVVSMIAPSGYRVSVENDDGLFVPRKMVRVETSESAKTIRFQIQDMKPGQNEGAIGLADTLKVGDIKWGLALGRLKNGSQAGKLMFHENDLVAGLYDRGALEFYYPDASSSGEVEVIRDVSGKLRQIRTPQCFIDIVDTVISGGQTLQYEVRVYAPLPYSGSGSVYTIPGGQSLLAKYAMGRGSSDGSNTFFVKKYAGSSLIATETMTRAPQGASTSEGIVLNNWTLSRVGIGGNAVTKTVNVTNTASGANRQEVSQISHTVSSYPEQTKTYSTSRLYAKYAEIPEHLFIDQRDYGQGNYSYVYIPYANAAQSINPITHGRTAFTIDPFGGWTFLNYNAKIADGSGNVVTPSNVGEEGLIIESGDEGYDISSKWSTAFFNDVVQANAWSVWRFPTNQNDYDGVSSRFAGEVVQRYPNGQGSRVTVQETVNRASFFYLGSEQIEVVCQYQPYDFPKATNRYGADYSARYTPLSGNPLLYGKPYFDFKSDGSKISYGYKETSYRGITNAFLELKVVGYHAGSLAYNDTGDASLATMTHGESTHSHEGVSFDVDAIQTINYKSSKELLVFDSKGSLRFKELWLKSGGGWVKYEDIVNTYDVYGRMLSSTRNGRVISETSWSGLYKAWQVDEHGIKTVFTRDGLGRVISEDVQGVSGVAGIPSTRTTHKYYDAKDRVVVTKVLSGSGDLTTRQSLDSEGRVLSRTDTNGLITSYTYTGLVSGQRVDLSHPNGTTEIRVKKPNGEPSQTLLIASDNTTILAREAHTYQDNVQVTGGAGVPASNRYVRTDHFELSGSSSAHPYTVKVSNSAGRVVYEEKASPTSLAFERFYQYDAQTGQVTQVNETEVPEGPALTGAATKTYLFSYDEMGNRTRSGVDVDGGGLSLAGADRVTDQETVYESSSDWWLSKKTTVYPEAGSANAVTTYSRKKLTGLSTSEVGITETKDAHGSVIKTTTTVDRASKSVTRLIDFQDGGSAQSVQVNGLEQSSTSKEGHQTVYEYDAAGRKVKENHPRGFSTVLTYEAGKARMLGIAHGVSASRPQGYPTTAGYNAKGEVDWVENAEGNKTYFLFNGRGQVTHKWGVATQPVWKEYDAFGQLWKAHSYRSGADGSQGVGEGDVTTYLYDNATGRVTSITDAAGRVTQFAYDQLERLRVKTTPSAGAGADTTATAAITVAYQYAAKTDELKKVTYTGDGGVTPDLDFTYHRTGQLASVTEAGSQTRLYHYEFGSGSGDSLKLVQEDLPSYYTVISEGASGGGKHELNAIAHLYQSNNSSTDMKGRPSELRLGEKGSSAGNLSKTRYKSKYSYQTTGRASGISVEDTYVNYGYLADSNHIETRTRGSLVETRIYEADRELLGSIEMHDGTALKVKHSYTYDVMARRGSRTQQGSHFSPYGGALFTSYTYNDRSEVGGVDVFQSASATTSESLRIAGRSFAWEYDLAGNHKSVTHKRVRAEQGALPKSHTYTRTSNSLNQYSNRQNPDYVEFSGVVDAAWTISAGNAPSNITRASRHADYFHHYSAIRGSNSGVVHDTLTLYGVKGGAGAGGKDQLFTHQEEVTLRPQTEDFKYDARGNLTIGGLWQYAWDAEDRLISMESTAAAIAAGVSAQKLRFKYDYLGRRYAKEIYTWSGSTFPATPTGTILYYWDGWNLVYEARYTHGGTNTFIEAKSYYWGLDWSGTLQGASGVGGLIGIRKHNGSSWSENYYPSYDGNGNLMALYQEDGTTRAEYEYGVYGKLLRASGDLAGLNPFRFATKYHDEETGLYQYQHRYYSPEIGRFLSRDPAGEGVNLYALVNNGPVNNFDVFGLYGYTPAMPALDWVAGSSSFTLEEKQEYYDQAWSGWERSVASNTSYYDDISRISAVGSIRVLDAESSIRREFISDWAVANTKAAAQAQQEWNSYRSEWVYGVGLGQDKGQSRTSQWVHSTLEGLGMAPGIGIPFDVVNGFVYAYEGDVLNSAISFGAAIPVLGYGANTMRGMRYADEFIDFGRHYGDDIVFGGGRHFDDLLPKTTPTSTALTKYWPDNNGFTGEVGEAFLYKGQKIDRYGGGDWSRFFSPQGTPDFARALPPGTAGQQLRTFEVMKPFPVQSGQVAPAFGQSGGGTQLLSPVKLETLLNRGILKEVGP